jgi:undecaprenyl-diphosphatase
MKEREVFRMPIWNAVLMGLIHGIAEFLPISSSGHFAVVNNLFKLSNISEGHPLFQAMLYLASLTSVCIVYWPEISAMAFELLSFADMGPFAGQERRHYPAARCFLMIVLGSLPLLLALPINSRMDVLNGHNIFIGVMLILTGCLLFVSDKMLPGKKTVKNIAVSDALIIGLCQSVATIPGLSRAAVTITAGFAVGLRRDFAVNFSYLLSIPAVFGAAILSMGDAMRAGVEWSFVPAYLIGTAVALLTGVGAIHLMRIFARNHKFGGFSYYCWVVGVMSVILHLIF